MAEHELAVFFLMKKSSRRKCIAEAWEIFMKYCNPFQLKNSQLYHGEVSGLFSGADQVFCIAVRNEDLAVIKYLKEVFASCDHPHLAPPVDRVREAGIIKKHALEYRGKVDSDGCFETPDWSRSDHDLCKMTGWPYVPLKIPEYIRPEPLKELEEMGRPGRRVTGVPSGGSGSMRAPFLSAMRTRRTFRRIIVRGVVIAGLVVLAVLIWTRRDDISLRLKYGAEGATKRKRGYAIAAITNVPYDLDLKALNNKLDEKAYYTRELRDKSLADVWLNCTVWFSADEKRDPFLTTTIQGFIKPEMKSRDGRSLWLCQGEGTRSAPGAEKENPQLKHDALLAAIADMDLCRLPDGRSLRSFQANNDFEGLRGHVIALARQCDQPIVRPPVTPVVKPSPPPPDVAKRICKCLADKWIMTHRIKLAHAEELDVVILEETETALRVRAKVGMLTIEKEQVEKIQPLSGEQIARNINGMLEPVKGEFATIQEHRDCNEFANELSEKYATYGVPLPGTCTLNLTKNERGRTIAVVGTARGRIRVKTGDRIDDFKVIGIDPETRTVAVRMGEGGDVLRIWPSP